MTRNHTKTIELNGRRYDARTGRVLADITPPAAKQTGQQKKPAGAVMDGVTKQKIRPARQHPETTAHTIHHKTERSKTLMRQAVKKPIPAKPSQTSIVRRPGTHLDVDPKRVSRAQKVQKSSRISRFGAPVTHTKLTHSPLPVQPEPEGTPPPPVFSAHHGDVVSPGGLKHRSGTGADFQKAMENSTSHTQPKHKKPNRRQNIARKFRVSPRIVNASAISLAVLLLVGFITYQNVPNLSMRLATARAGVDGTLPGYQPSGFSLKGPIQYQPGQITISFGSNSDDRQFHVNQRASTWNSESLLEGFVATDNRSYQTYESNGKTVYIYDDNNATWVDGGVWYQIEGKSSLSSDQLLRLAASM